MKAVETSDLERNFARALHAMREALHILDQLGDAQVASHLDLAICRLERRLGIDVCAEDGTVALHASLTEELLSSSAVDDIGCPWD